MNYYNEIKEQLIRSKIYDKVKDYSKERNRVKAYFEKNLVAIPLT